MIAFDPSAVSRASLPKNSKFLPSSQELSRKLPERDAITTTWGSGGLSKYTCNPNSPYNKPRYPQYYPSKYRVF